MKKLIFVVAAALVAVSASAQVGVIAGITSTKSDYKEAWASINEVTQYHVGATLKFPLPFGLAVQPSVIYNVKGTSIEALKGEDVSAFKTDSKTGILEVPVQVQWGVSIADVVRPYVFAEPFVGVAINGENKVDLAGLVDTEDKAEWDNLKDRLEYGFGVGVGVGVLVTAVVLLPDFFPHPARSAAARTIPATKTQRKTTLARSIVSRRSLITPPPYRA